MKYYSKANIITIVICVLVTFSCIGPVSGKFWLDKESRLPAWFKNPSNIPRDSLKVRIIEYEPTFTPVGKIKVLILTMDNNIIDEGIGKSEFHPKTLNDDHTGPPSWSIVRINGTTEIYEHSKRGDTLKIVLDVP